MVIMVKKFKNNLAYLEYLTPKVDNFLGVPHKPGQE